MPRHPADAATPVRDAPLLTDDDPDPRDIIESCSQKCRRDVLTDRGLELMASDGDFSTNCYECRECGSWCLRHEVEP